MEMVTCNLSLNKRRAWFLWYERPFAGHDTEGDGSFLFLPYDL